MSSTADIADAGEAVQWFLTIGKQQLSEAGELPEWFQQLQIQFHGLMQAGAWAVGEPDGSTIMGFRCEGRTHRKSCVEYRQDSIDHDGGLTVCPKCRAAVHGLFEAGPTPYNCHPCWKDTHA